MMQNMRVLLVISVLVMVLGVGSAVAETYFIYDDFGGTWCDANKTYDGDSNMCWAAAISNVLDYGAWEVAAYPTAPEILAYYKACGGKVGGLPLDGLYWWLNGLASPPGGNFWPAYRATAMWDGVFPNPENIESLLRGGYAVTLGISSPSIGVGHALTCWGVQYSTTPGGLRIYSSIFVTDSDDDATALLEVPITPGGWHWDLGGRFSGWELVGVEGFELQPVMRFDHRDTRPIVTLDPFQKLKEVFKLHPFLSFDYRWDGPFPQDQNAKSHFTIKALLKDNEWILLFEDFFDLEELGVWTAVNLQIPDELLGLRTLLFEMEGDGQLSLYRLDYVPLPPSLWLLASGLAGLLAWRRLSS